MGNKKGILLVIAGAAAALAAAASVAIYVKSKLDSEQKLICGLDVDDYEFSSAQEETVPEENTNEQSDDAQADESDIDK